MPTMRRIAITALVIGCGGAPGPTTPTAPPSAAPAPASAPRVWTYRKLVAGAASGRATRATFTLAIDGDRAELVEVDDTAAGVASLADADRATTWTRVSTRTYRGTAHAGSGAELLDLDTPGQQPLHVRCARIAVDAAVAGARRVATGTLDGHGCDPGRWDPPTVAHVPALACGEDAPEADAGDSDDDDRLVFGEAVPIEYAVENDGCALRGGGLRVGAPAAR
jgi:hypothetical protein